MSYCVHCGRWLEPPRRLYCDDRCKRRAYRRQRAGLPENAYQGGARRGRVPLARKTNAELLDARPRPVLSESDLRRFV